MEKNTIPTPLDLIETPAKFAGKLAGKGLNVAKNLATDGFNTLTQSLKTTIHTQIKNIRSLIGHTLKNLPIIPIDIK